ncbi:MAG: D-alanyl-D-alanine endopeptidase [Pseudomonadota bacterium]
MRIKLNTLCLLAAVLASSLLLSSAAQAVPSAEANVRAASAAKAPSAQKKRPKRQAAKPATKKTKKALRTKVHAEAAVPNKLSVESASALVLEQGGNALYQKNADAVVPIASITKLMTAMVVLDSHPALQESISISEQDVDYLKGSRSRLAVGTVLSRENALLLALMSSENRAASALARHYPGGMSAFLSAMNQKARQLGMRNTHFEDPTGLTSNNVSTARDLAKMVLAAHSYPLIREFSTTASATVDLGGHSTDFMNTNQLVRGGSWDIGLSKTGYIQEAGRCLVMQVRLSDKPMIIVLLDSMGKLARISDANRIKRWLEHAASVQKTLAKA